jgi:hypothetical protein
LKNGGRQKITPGSHLYVGVKIDFGDFYEKSALFSDRL